MVKLASSSASFRQRALRDLNAARVAFLLDGSSICPIAARIAASAFSYVVLATSSFRSAASAGCSARRSHVVPRAKARSARAMVRLDFMGWLRSQHAVRVVAALSVVHCRSCTAYCSFHKPLSLKNAANFFELCGYVTGGKSNLPQSLNI